MQMIAFPHVTFERRFYILLHLPQPLRLPQESCDHSNSTKSKMMLLKSLMVLFPFFENKQIISYPSSPWLRCVWSIEELSSQERHVSDSSALRADAVRPF